MADDQLFHRFGKEFAQGTVLFREGEPGKEMYVVQQGRVHVSKKAGEVEKILATLGPGEFLGEMSILNNKPRSATATCADASSRVVHYLATAAEKVPKGPTGQHRLAIKPPELASRVGVRTEQAEEVLGKLLKSKIVALEADGSLVADVAKLRHFLEFLQMKAQFGDIT